MLTMMRRGWRGFGAEEMGPPEPDLLADQPGLATLDGCPEGAVCTQYGFTTGGGVSSSSIDWNAIVKVVGSVAQGSVAALAAYEKATGHGVPTLAGSYLSGNYFSSGGKLSTTPTWVWPVAIGGGVVVLGLLAVLLIPPRRSVPVAA